ncbi:MAG TPA: hypothetical protein VKZ49_07000 [Polyangiaceae bacterium]|nr:hypothetical protein [Polyangiaceae bacterium]
MPFSELVRRRSPEQWIALSLQELSKARAAFGQRDATGGISGAKRAAGMALNAALVVRPRPSWGRTYVEHLRALSDDAAAPPPVQRAARELLGARGPSSGVIGLGTPGRDERLIEAARTVMAHGYALAFGATGKLE